MAKTITSPLDGYTGPAQFAEVTLDFKNGVATTERISKSLEAYLKRRGYDVKGSNTKVPAETKAEAKAEGDGGDVL